MAEGLAVFGGIVPSMVDGPGKRVVIHTAGCSVGCPGCFNPHTHKAAGPGVSFFPPHIYASDTVTEMEANGATGVTISGGEPTDQLSDLLVYLIELRETWKVDSIILFTGRKIEQLRKQALWRAIEFMKLVDVVIDGPFMRKKMESEWMRGSTNQTIHLVTDRHSLDEFHTREVEVTVSGGQITFLGFPTQELLEEFGSVES